MGLIVRESTAPILTGEITSGTEVENEFDKVFVLIGETSGSEGNIEDVNISSNASIDGAKINNASITTAKMKDSDIPGSKINDSILTTAEFVATSVPQANVSSTATADVFTTLTTFQDVPSVTAWTVTPGESNFIRLGYTFGATVSGGASEVYAFGFSVDGAIVTNAEWQIDSTVVPFGFHFSYSTLVASSGSIIAKPVYRITALPSGGSINFSLTRSFTGMIVPVK